MFDAAHAALFALRIEQVAAPIKTHSRLVVLGVRLADVRGEPIDKVQEASAACGL